MMTTSLLPSSFNNYCKVALAFNPLEHRQRSEPKRQRRVDVDAGSGYLTQGLTTLEEL
jgi:hypothetical protein